MTIHLRSFLFGACALLIGCADQQGQAPDDPATVESAQPLTAAVKLGAIPLARDANGIPHLMRGGDSMPKLPAATATESARQHLARLSPAWGLRSAAAMPDLQALGEVPVAGGTVVRFRQVIAGLPVEPTAGGEVHVMVTPDGGLVGVGGKLVSTETAHVAAPKFVDDDAGAIARAVNDKYKMHELTSHMLAPTRTAADGSTLRTGASAGVTVSMSRARQAWIPSGKALVAAWIVEAYSSPNNSSNGDAYRTVIAANGKVLSRTDLRASDGFKYRVFAETTGEFHPFDGPIEDSSPNKIPFDAFPNTPAPPAFVAPNLVTVVGTNHPVSGTPDPWLAPGSSSTLTGNNVHAYTDANPPDGLSAGDFAADVLPDGTFDRTVDLTKGPFDSTDQTKAGITSLFYLINWMHDFWYDGGFTEAAGNGQDNNYGRGGVDHDAVLGEAQDNALADVPSKDNANMATPADGMPGQMQVFVWDNVDNRKLNLNPDTSPKGKGIETNTAQFSTGTFNITADLILAADKVQGKDDKGNVVGTFTDNCEPPDAASYAGKIVIVDRGFCSFQRKAANAIIGGAAGMILADTIAADIHPIGLGPDQDITDPTPIATFSVTQADGVALKAEVGKQTVTMFRNPSPDLDGTLDVTVVGHEYGHFVHHRLQSCETKLCGAMSEGWADFSALLVSSRAPDFKDDNQQFPLAIFSTRGISPESQYYGIRRAPYSTNHAVNPLSFHHMSDGAELPPPPFDGGDPATNSEVHAAGEVWASMLWEGYVALQRQPGADFEATRLKMRQYEVAGLLLAPPDSTPTETRDAILTAVKAKSPDDYNVLLQAYAKRGFGSCAVSPDRNSQDFAAIVDSAEIKGRPDFGNLSYAGTQACDNDAFLDPGEQFEITVPITNGGAVKMTNVKATLHSALVQLSDPTKVTVPLGNLDIGAKATATFTVTLADSVTVPTESDITIEVTSDDGCQVAAVPLITRFNTDDKPNSSASDDFNSETTAWTPSGDGLWQHARDTGLDGFLIGAESGAPSDTSMTSPPITAGAAPVSLSFLTAWDFETTGANGAGDAVDGGVIEYSTDAGKTWTDLSTIATVPYTKTLVTDTDNVLIGRQVFGGQNDNGSQVSIDLGTKLANQTFQLRFRIGTDTGGGGGGWIVDELAFAGITNTPFTTLVADGNHCAPTDPTNNHDDGGCCQAGGMATGNIAAAIGMLGLVLRRRRRRAAH